MENMIDKLCSEYADRYSYNYLIYKGYFKYVRLLIILNLHRKWGFGGFLWRLRKYILIIELLSSVKQSNSVL